MLTRTRDFLRRYPRGDALFFTRHVNRTIGSFTAAVLFDTRVTPNMLSVAGLVVHVVAAAVLTLAPSPADLPTTLVVLVLWQLAFGLDCADGQLARARGSSSAFGAWLDIFLDVVSHVLVYGVLAVYLASALPLDGRTAALVTAVALGGPLIQLFTSYEHAPLGPDPAVADPPGWYRRALLAQHALDYGAFLFIAAVLLPWPPVLLAYLVISAVLHAAAALVRLILNWRREMRRP